MGPLITFERIEQSASNLKRSVGTIKLAPSGRGLGDVTQFRILGPSNYNFGTNRDIRFKFGTEIEDRPSLRMDHVRNEPKWAWPGSHDLISKFWGPLNNF